MNASLRGLGLALVAFGALSAAVAAGHFPELGEWLLRGKSYGYAVPLLTICTGWLLASGANRSREGNRGLLPKALLAVLIALPLLTLGSYGLQALVSDRQAQQVDDLRHWLEMAPNSAAAFLAVGAALLLAFRSEAKFRVAYVVAALFATAVALSALLGYFLHLEALYTVAGMISMRLPTAIALAVICFGLWLLYDEVGAKWQRGAQVHHGRITHRSLMVLSLVAVSAGVSGFSLLQGAHEAELSQSMLLTARTNATAVKESIQHKLWFPKVIANRPIVVKLLSELQQSSPTADHKALMQDVMGSFLTADIQGVRFLGAGRELRGEMGRFDGEGDAFADRLSIDGLQAELRWNNGYLLHTEARVESGGQLVGFVVTEQRLKAVDALLSELRSSNPSADALICSRANDAAICSPTRFYAKPFSIPMFTQDGKPNMPINRALLGESGVRSATDLRGVRVIAAFVPISPLGLGLVVKTDAATLYAPLRERLAILIPLMAAVIALGAWALHLRVQPLLKQFLQEQELNKQILQNAHEAFITVDGDGNVVDWNHAAEVMMGVTAAHARGKKVSELLLPARNGQRAAAADDAALDLSEGVRELSVIGAGGAPTTLELSIKEMPSGTGTRKFIFARDLTARRLAERRLRASEQSLRTITDNVPALITKISSDGVVLFANEHCSKVYGRPLERIVGHTIQEIRGAEVLEQIRPHMERVLAGQAVMFESHSEIAGVRHHFQQSYVPDLAPDGSVEAFYAVSVDITDIKGNEQRLAESEKRLRDITDNLPVLISYIDPERRVRFINATCRDWLGIEPTVALGKTLKDLGSGFGSNSECLSQALMGEKVSCETSISREGRQRLLATDFVPDLGTAGSVAGIYALSADVTHLKAVERQLTEMLDQDALTGQANRRCLNRKLPEALARSKRNGKGVGLMFLDVDRFKSINDSRGHAAGDAVLVEFARRLAANVRETDTVVRLAGDEFVVLLEGLGEPVEAGKVAEKILNAMLEPFTVEGEQISVSTSIGVTYQASAAVMPTADDLMERADAALYAAKRAGRGCYRLGSEESAETGEAVIRPANPS